MLWTHLVKIEVRSFMRCCLKKIGERSQFSGQICPGN